MIVKQKGGDKMARTSFTTTIESNLQEAFKLKCKEKNLNMNEVLETFMNAYLNEEFEVSIEKVVGYQYSLVSKK